MHFKDLYEVSLFLACLLEGRGGGGCRCQGQRRGALRPLQGGDDARRASRCPRFLGRAAPPGSRSACRDAANLPRGGGECVPSLGQLVCSPFPSNPRYLRGINHMQTSQTIKTRMNVQVGRQTPKKNGKAEGSHDLPGFCLSTSLFCCRWVL